MGLLLLFSGLLHLMFADWQPYLSAEASVEHVQCWWLRKLHGVGWLFFDAILTLVFAALFWMAWPSGIHSLLGR